jgi:hypothetical protein
MLLAKAGSAHGKTAQINLFNELKMHNQTMINLLEDIRDKGEVAVGPIKEFESSVNNLLGRSLQ